MSTHPVCVDVAQGPLQVGRRLVSGSSWRQRHSAAVGLTGAGRGPGVSAHARGKMAVRHRRRNLFRSGRKDGEKALRGAFRTRSCGRWGARRDGTYVGLWRGNRDVGLWSPALPLGAGAGDRALGAIRPKEGQEVISRSCSPVRRDFVSGFVRNSSRSRLPACCSPAFAPVEPL